jgi:hypothetical protein
VLDALCIYKLTPERLFFMGGATIIIPLPFFNEISIGDHLVFKRENIKKRRDT